jgi:hypothetical protein
MGEWSASRPGRALPPGKGPPVPTIQEAGWAPEPVWTQRLYNVTISNTSVVGQTKYDTLVLAVYGRVDHLYRYRFPFEPRVLWSQASQKLFIANIKKPEFPLFIPVVFNRGYTYPWGYVDYTICVTCIMYQQLWGYKVEEKLYLGVREQKKVEYHWFILYKYCNLNTPSLITPQGTIF